MLSKLTVTIISQHIHVSYYYVVHQWPLTFLAPGTSFMEDHLSTDQAGVGDGSGVNLRDGEWQTKLHSLV